MVEGRVSILCALRKKGVLTNVMDTTRGQIKVDSYNVVEETMYLTPKTILVDLARAQASIKN